MDPQVKRMGMAAAGFAGLLVIGFGGYTLIGHRPHTIPVVEAQSGPVRVRPDNPGGMQIAGANEQIMGGAGGSQTDAMAPPPEVPQPQALRAEIAAAQEPPPAQTVSLSTPPPAPPPVIDSMPETRPAPPLAHSPAKAVVTAPPAHAAVAPAAPSAAPSGGTQVQLAALDSAQAAMAEWDRLSKRLPELFRPHHPEVQRTDRDGKTFFRLRTGGFTDIASATAFCAQLRSKGAGCSIASF
jgi:SPOR domain